MTSVKPVAAVRGKTIRLTWTEGPTKGSTYEHVFHQDGTVEWRDADHPPKSAPKPGAPAERVPYAAFEVTPKVFAVSYLSTTSGFTLTVVLDFATGAMVGIASGAKDWFPIRGTFEMVD